MVFRVSPQSAELLREAHTKMGAFVTGRRTFDITNGWGGSPPLGVPTFVLTHTVPQEWVYEGSPFTFVTDGVESAVEQAKAAAGEKDRKSTRLNSSHANISYAVFCLKKKKTQHV